MAKKQEVAEEPLRGRVSQSDIPALPLEQSTKIAKALWDNFAGKGAAPHNIALAVDLSPTSSGWRVLCGASLAYGLTDGGYAASAINLTELGRRAVAPTREGDDLAALQEAALKPRVPVEFFRRYDRAKFPREDIAANVLVELGVPKERAAEFVSLLKKNGEYVGFIRNTKTGPFVALDGTHGPGDKEQVDDDITPPPLVDEPAPEAERNDSRASIDVKPSLNNRVFITHGKNTKIMEQIKRLVTLASFEPVVSVQRETAAKPVPDKVMDDMRSCAAAVIHVASEGDLLDADGNRHPQINPNVLIEIGAAMALYRGRFILVVEHGVSLPSNLQGLYESRYSGDSIELDAGMKVLEALTGLKTNQ